MLELKDLYFTAPVADGNDGESVRTIIDGISFTFEKGKFYAVTGPNGSGKTTLAKLIMGIHALTAGDILFDGKNINGLSITGTRPCRPQLQLPASGAVQGDHLSGSSGHGSRER